VRLATVKRRCRRFKDGHFSLDDRFESHRPRGDIGEVISQFLSEEPFISARILAKKLATSEQIIKEIRTRNLGKREFTRIRMAQNLSARNKRK
jgi:hypothetical protein